MTPHESGSRYCINAVAVRRSKGFHTGAERLQSGHTSIRELSGTADGTLRSSMAMHLESNDVSPKAVAILNQRNVDRNRSRIKPVGKGRAPRPFLEPKIRQPMPEIQIVRGSRLIPPPQNFRRPPRFLRFFGPFLGSNRIVDD